MKHFLLLLSVLFIGHFAQAQSSSTYSNLSFTKGTVLKSENERFTLRFQDDGNLVVYKNGNRPIWASHTDGQPAKVLRFQPDGNLVIYDDNNHPIWASNTNKGNGTYTLRMQSDGNLVIYNKANQPIWATNTGGL